MYYKRASATTSQHTIHYLIMQQFQRATSETQAGRKVSKIWQHAVRNNFSPNKYVNF